jgi:hypothetical protein
VSRWRVESVVASKKKERKEIHFPKEEEVPSTKNVPKRNQRIT